MMNQSKVLYLSAAALGTLCLQGCSDAEEPAVEQIEKLAVREDASDNTTATAQEDANFVEEGPCTGLTGPEDQNILMCVACIMQTEIVVNTTDCANAIAVTLPLIEEAGFARRLSDRAYDLTEHMLKTGRMLDEVVSGHTGRMLDAIPVLGDARRRLEEVDDNSEAYYHAAAESTATEEERKAMLEAFPALADAERLWNENGISGHYRALEEAITEGGDAVGETTSADGGDDTVTTEEAGEAADEESDTIQDDDNDDAEEIQAQLEQAKEVCGAAKTIVQCSMQCGATEVEHETLTLTQALADCEANGLL